MQGVLGPATLRSVRRCQATMPQACSMRATPPWIHFGPLPTPLSATYFGGPRPCAHPSTRSARPGRRCGRAVARACQRHGDGSRVKGSSRPHPHPHARELAPRSLGAGKPLPLGVEPESPRPHSGERHQNCTHSKYAVKRTGQLNSMKALMGRMDQSHGLRRTQPDLSARLNLLSGGDRSQLYARSPQPGSPQPESP